MIFAFLVAASAGALFLPLAALSTRSSASRLRGCGVRIFAVLPGAREGDPAPASAALGAVFGSS